MNNHVRIDGKHDRELQLSINTASSTSDPKEVDRLSQRLRRELFNLDVGFVSPSSKLPAPAGAKGDSVTWSTIALTLAASGGVLTSVIAVIRDWLLRQPVPVVIEVSMGGDSIRIEGSWTPEHQKLVDAFLAKHDQPCR